MAQGLSYTFSCPANAVYQPINDIVVKIVKEGKYPGGCFRRTITIPSIT